MEGFWDKPRYLVGKLENLEETYVDIERTCKLHRERSQIYLGTQRDNHSSNLFTSIRE